MTDELRGKRIAILATDGVEQVELEHPDDLPAFCAAIVREFAAVHAS